MARLSPESVRMSMLLSFCIQIQFRMQFGQGNVALVLVFGIANRVLYKLALVPLADYSLFLAQLQTSGYLLVYFATLAARLR